MACNQLVADIMNTVDMVDITIPIMLELVVADSNFADAGIKEDSSLIGKIRNMVARSLQNYHSSIVVDRNSEEVAVALVGQQA